jgi:restriction system protein
MIPVLNALINLGGSGTIEEINEKVYELENFSEEILQVPIKRMALKTKLITD